MAAGRIPPLDMNTLTARLAAIKEEMGPPPWAVQVIKTDQIVVTAICQAPGHQNDHHYHICDECWFIAEGELSWQYEHDTERHFVRAGDFVFAPMNLWHHIEVHGDKPAIRLGISVASEFHRYDRPGCMPAPK
jgi:mannose-6-phosphate isomerase-like protein (cupin superfamily)